jgi:hypothetical protein
VITFEQVLYYKLDVQSMCEACSDGLDLHALDEGASYCTYAGSKVVDVLEVRLVSLYGRTSFDPPYYVDHVLCKSTDAVQPLGSLFPHTAFS